MNDHFHIYLITLIIISLMSGVSKYVSVFASEESIENSNEQDFTKKTPAPDNREMNNEAASNKAGRRWPDVFVPSEKIDADSVISFPVDI